MWFYHEEDHTIHSISHYDTNAVLFEGYNRNIICYRNMKRPRQHFSYNKNTSLWTSDLSGDTLGLEHDDYRVGESIQAKSVSEDFTNLGIKWKMEYCENPTDEILEKIEKAIG